MSARQKTDMPGNFESFVALDPHCLRYRQLFTACYAGQCTGGSWWGRYLPPSGLQHANASQAATPRMP